MCDEGKEPKGEKKPAQEAETSQGYCGLCRVLYQDLDQHLSSLLHLDAVDLARKGMEPSSSRSSQSGHSLLERFLHDVFTHHPHSYSQPNSTAAPSGPPVEATPTPRPLAETTPPPATWSTWQRIRRQQHREEFSSEHCSSTIEDVIRRYCYGKEEDERSDSLHFSLPVSMETQTDWDVEVQDFKDQSEAPPGVETLLEMKVDVEQDYTEQLQWVLENEGKEGKGGFLDRPIESVFPAPQFVPPSFRGKSWSQIEKEDEARVLKLVQQFKSGVRTCYFESESLCRFGWHGYRTKTTPEMLPLFDHEEEEEPRKRKRRSFRMASRCQVVKLSRATQTLHMSSPTIATALESSQFPPAELTPPMPPSAPPLGHSTLSEPLISDQLSDRYSSVLTPLQPQTSVLFLLCSPPGHASLLSPRRRRRSARALRSKVTYRQLPLTPLSVKALKPVKPRCVRQLFRNLSPELNTGPAPTETTPPRREGLRSCRRPRT